MSEPQAEVAAHAEAIWRRLPKADPQHPYLVRKRVRPHGIRQNNDDLVVPVRYAGRITSLQTISPTERRRFLAGGRITGCNFSIGDAADHVGGLLRVMQPGCDAD